jgi:hypothetical protein
MTDSENDLIANWQDRIGILRKRGRISGAALAVMPMGEIDARRGRPPAPERLSDDERELWDKLTYSRRPGWFAGAENVLETYVVTVSQMQALEEALRKATPGINARYMKLSRIHRQTAGLASLLATRLRLTPGSKLDTRTPTDGELPVA